MCMQLLIYCLGCCNSIWVWHFGTEICECVRGRNAHLQAFCRRGRSLTKTNFYTGTFLLSSNDYTTNFHLHLQFLHMPHRLKLDLWYSQILTLSLLLAVQTQNSRIKTSLLWKFYGITLHAESILSLPRWFHLRASIPLGCFIYLVYVYGHPNKPHYGCCLSIRLWQILTCYSYAVGMFHTVVDRHCLSLSVGLYENHDAKVKKSRHTFRKVAKFTANSRCQFTVIYRVKKRLIDKHFSSLPSQQSVMYRRLTKWLTLIIFSNFQEQFY